MITKKEYAEFISQSNHIEDAAKAVLSKIEELNLTVSIDIKQLKDEFKTQLFSKLLAVDKGLKMQYELHKTDKAKLDLINKTVSVEGYEEITELESLMQTYLDNVNHSYFTSSLSSVRLDAESYLIDYKGCRESCFRNQIIDVTETELYKEFKALEETLNNMYDRGIFGEHIFNSNGFYNQLNKVLKANNFNQKIEINESYIYQFLLDKEEELSKQNQSTTE